MTPWLQDPDVTLYHGDCLQVLRELPSSSVHMCCTSPPFYGLRDYGTGEWEGGQPDCDHKAGGEPQLHVGSDGKLGRNNTNWDHRHGAYGAECGKCGARRVDKQIGLEETPDQWVERLVQVFREVRRVLRDDGTLWVEIGDSYNGGGVGGGPPGERLVGTGDFRADSRSTTRAPNVKPKDLLGQPWLLAFALRADGWWLRSEIIWARPNPMPESVTDRPTKSHSTVFLLSKQPRYFYDADAIREPLNEASAARYAYGFNNGSGAPPGQPKYEKAGTGVTLEAPTAGANARSVWSIPTQPTPFAHFATWPEALCRRMILAGTSEKGRCPVCGAPWVRETTSELGPSNRKPDTRAYVSPHGTDGGGSQGLSRSDTHVAGLMRHVTTTGWAPSCMCHFGDGRGPRQPIPCTVLDPFAGSATTNLVARNTGRHSIGIELNETYLHIAGRRLQQLSLLA